MSVEVEPAARFAIRVAALLGTPVDGERLEDLVSWIRSRDVVVRATEHRDTRRDVEELWRAQAATLDRIREIMLTTSDASAVLAAIAAELNRAL